MLISLSLSYTVSITLYIIYSYLHIYSYFIAYLKWENIKNGWFEVYAKCIALLFWSFCAVTGELCMTGNQPELITGQKLTLGWVETTTELRWAGKLGRLCNVLIPHSPLFFNSLSFPWYFAAFQIKKNVLYLSTLCVWIGLVTRFGQENAEKPMKSP